MKYTYKRKCSVEIHSREEATDVSMHSAKARSLKGNLKKNSNNKRITTIRTILGKLMFT
jgi:hypothetical protein